MPTTEPAHAPWDPLAPGDDHTPFLASLRASRARRAQARRDRRRQRGGRSAAIVAAATLTLAAGGAAAHEGTGGASPSSAGGATPSAGAGSALLKPRGSVVAALQRKLGIPADGVYGPQTRRAVRRFQRANGLQVDGVAGPATLGALGLAAREAAAARPAKPAPAVRVSPLLRRIARCESGGDPTAVSADGRYRGKYQFSRATWRAMGGSGDPAAAPEAEQDRRAAALLRQAGTSPWPNCA